MAIGAQVRWLFGKHERLTLDPWRSMFIDLDDWTRTVENWSPQPQRILELGCGEGCSTPKPVEAFAAARVAAIDIGDHIGRPYSGPAERVNLHKALVEQPRFVRYPVNESARDRARLISRTAQPVEYAGHGT